ncbi:MAG: hypothetical protein M3258_00695 [Thermoproteota archaeon]|nr:hypothetical protein [Thermoproteota archaeon]
MWRPSLPALLVFLLAITFNFPTGLAAKYYSKQTDFTESFVPLTGFRWNHDDLDSCVYKERGVNNSYYVWTKLAVQKWQHALQEYTHNDEGWSIRTRYVHSVTELESCDIKFYIYSKYVRFPNYPAQAGAYTSITFHQSEGNLDARVYLSPLVLHGDGVTEINLPSYAFRNSVVHEIGHTLGLGHMQLQKRYLMSPQFDFWEESDQLPITTLELDALVKVYGIDGFG